MRVGFFILLPTLELVVRRGRGPCCSAALRGVGWELGEVSCPLLSPRLALCVCHPGLGWLSQAWGRDTEDPAVCRGSGCDPRDTFPPSPGGCSRANPPAAVPSARDPSPNPPRLRCPSPAAAPAQPTVGTAAPSAGLRLGRGGGVLRWGVPSPGTGPRVKMEGARTPGEGGCCDAPAAAAQSGKLLHGCSSSSESHQTQVSLNFVPNSSCDTKKLEAGKRRLSEPFAARPEEEKPRPGVGAQLPARGSQQTPTVKAGAAPGGLRARGCSSRGSPAPTGLRGPPAPAKPPSPVQRPGATRPPHPPGWTRTPRCAPGASQAAP